jgi:hypothetical protein
MTVVDSYKLEIDVIGSVEKLPEFSEIEQREQTSSPKREDIISNELSLPFKVTSQEESKANNSTKKQTARLEE